MGIGPSSIHSKGAFAKELIPRNTSLGLYLGPVITEREETNRAWGKMLSCYNLGINKRYSVEPMVYVDTWTGR